MDEAAQAAHLQTLGKIAALEVAVITLINASDRASELREDISNGVRRMVEVLRPDHALLAKALEESGADLVSTD